MLQSPRPYILTSRRFTSRTALRPIRSLHRTTDAAGELAPQVATGARPNAHTAPLLVHHFVRLLEGIVIMSAKPLWNSNFRNIVVYRNTSKIDDLISRLWGQLVSSITITDSADTKKRGKLSAKLGKLASLVGLGEIGGEVELERSTNKAISQLATLTYENKVQILHAFQAESEELRYLHAFQGLELFPDDSSQSPADWRSSAWPEKDDEFLGYTIGCFRAQRLVPPDEGMANPVTEVLADIKSLWQLQSVPGSSLRVLVPFLTQFCTLSSQQSLVALAHSTRAEGIWVNILGLAKRTDGLFTCDPVAFSIMG